MRLSDVAMRTSGTLKYIQYIPPTLVAMTRLPSTRARIAPDFDSRPRYLPPYAWAKAGPCLVQWTRSREVATASRGMRRVSWGLVGAEGTAPRPLHAGGSPAPG